MKKSRSYWWQLPERVRFLIAGGYNTVFGYAIFVLLLWLFNGRLHYLVVGLIANIIAVISAFLVHRNLVFRSNAGLSGSFMRFYASQLLSMLFGIIGLYCLVQFTLLKPMVAQALVITASVALSYLLHRHYSFRERQHPVKD